MIEPAHSLQAPSSPASIPLGYTMAEYSLRRVLDYKLVFDCLADGSNGMVPLHVLAARWPREGEEMADSKLPQGCLDEWKSQANENGYLDWDGFSDGLAKALSADSARLSKTTPTAPETSTTRRDLGASLLRNPVEPAEIEEFLGACDRASLVQVLARVKKEEYRCQMSLQQLAAERKKMASEEGGKTGQATTQPSEPSNPEPSLVATGNEKEELLKGMEVLERTRQWFSDRLGQLALQRSSNKKYGKEELLAIMEGGRPSPSSQANQTLHHLQQINKHLGTLAMTTPTLTTPTDQLSAQEKMKARKAHRLHSDPGPGIYAKGQKGHRHSNSSTTSAAPVTRDLPLHTSSPIRPTNGPSRAHVVGIDVPSSPTSPPPAVPSPASFAPPRRSSSMREVRDTPTSRRVLAFPTNDGTRGVVSAGSHDPTMKRNTPRRSNSLKYPGDERSKSSSSHVDLPSGVAVEGPTHNYPPQYPLRETVSLSQLPGGGYAASGQHRGMAGVNHMTVGGPLGGGGSDHMTSKSVSMQNISSRPPPGNQPVVGSDGTHRRRHKDKHRHRSSSHSLQGSVESLPTYPTRAEKSKELRAKQVAAHQRILMMEQSYNYQGSEINPPPHSTADNSYTRSVV